MKGVSHRVGGTSVNKWGGQKARSQHGGAGMGMGRILGFMLSKSRSHWGVLSRRESWYHL